MMHSDKRAEIVADCMLEVWTALGTGYPVTKAPRTGGYTVQILAGAYGALAAADIMPAAAGSEVRVFPSALGDGGLTAKVRPCI